VDDLEAAHATMEGAGCTESRQQQDEPQIQGPRRAHDRHPRPGLDEQIKARMPLYQPRRHDVAEYSGALKLSDT